MSRVRVLVLRAAGVNCDLETVRAWEIAGAEVEHLHVRELMESPRRLDKFQILTLPGGFSYGDDISAGKILAVQIRRTLGQALRSFIDAGRLVLGICNGFQALVKAGFLPSADPDVCTITYNEPSGFQDRWVRLQAGSTPCAFLKPGSTYDMPIAHGEGRVIFRDAQVRERLVASAAVALRYVPGGPDPAAPANPNGSEADAAGLCDATGRVLGLMPHPERFIEATQHPTWTSRPVESMPDGLKIFTQAVTFFR